MSRIASLALVVSLVAASLPAQEASPFHAGQWAMQFGGNSDLFSLGVLHFTSARSAWLLDISNSISVLNATFTDKLGGTTGSGDQQFINVDARLGKRSYQTRRASVVSFETLGIESGFFDQMVAFTGGDIRQTQWNAGANLELGAAYMLTSGVSVGGTASFSAGYFSYKRDDPSETIKGHGYYDNIRVIVALGLYF